MSVLVHREIGAAGQAGPGRSAITVPGRAQVPVRRPRRGEAVRPPTRSRMPAGRGPAPAVGCAGRSRPQRWPLLAAVGVAVFAAVLAMGLFAGGVAESGTAAVPERTVLVHLAPGDTLWDAATRYAPSSDPAAVVDRIEELNHLDGPAVTVGTPLFVPHQGAQPGR